MYMQTANADWGGGISGGSSELGSLTDILSAIGKGATAVSNVIQARQQGQGTVVYLPPTGPGGGGGVFGEDYYPIIAPAPKPSTVIAGMSMGTLALVGLGVFMLVRSRRR